MERPYSSTRSSISTMKKRGGLLSKCNKNIYEGGRDSHRGEICLHDPHKFTGSCAASLGTGLHDAERLHSPETRRLTAPERGPPSACQSLQALTSNLPAQQTGQRCNNALARGFVAPPLSGPASPWDVSSVRAQPYHGVIFAGGGVDIPSPPLPQSHTNKKSQQACRLPRRRAGLASSCIPSVTWKDRVTGRQRS